jgi:hypothetical protein
MTRDYAQQVRTAPADPEAQFRDGQWQAIDAVVNQRRKLLVVQRTGWGKSSVYFISKRTLRDRLTVVGADAKLNADRGLTGERCQLAIPANSTARNCQSCARSDLCHGNNWRHVALSAHIAHNWGTAFGGIAASGSRM